MRVAVTGAAGYLGTNVVDHAAAVGHDVVAIDRVDSWVTAPDSVQAIHADVLDGPGMRRALTGVEIVMHLAARITLRHVDDDAWRVNTAGVATVARAALDAGVRRFVLCSSVEAFDGRGCASGIDETSPRSVAEDLPVYDRSKYAGEQELLRVVEDGLDAVICNPTGVYGPIDNPNRLSRLNAMVRDAALGRAPASVAGGFDLVDVRDVARSLLRAADVGRTGENYLLSGEMVTIHELLTVAARVVGRRGPVAAVPLEVVRAVLPIAGPLAEAQGLDIMSPAAIGHLLAAPVVNGSKARRELGHQTRPSAQTVRDLVAHFVQTGVLERRGRREPTPAG